MIGELVTLLKHEKVSIKLFETYCCCLKKGLPKAVEKDERKRNELIACAKAVVKKYRSFHKHKMDSFKKND